MRKTIKLRNIINILINEYHAIIHKLRKACFSLKSYSFNGHQSIVENCMFIQSNIQSSHKSIFQNILNTNSNFEKPDDLNRTGIKLYSLSNEYIDKKDAQRAFNKYVKYKVNKKFGENILIFKQIRELDREIMRKIKGINLILLTNCLNFKIFLI
jgi:hypothetical protein